MRDKDFHLKVITPDRVVYDGQVSEVKLPIHDGYMGILHNHAPLVAPVGEGILTAQSASNPVEMFVSNGFLQVGENEVRVVCDSGELGEEIDLERARAAEAKAREKIGQRMKADLDRPHTAAALQRSLIRQMLAEKHRRKGQSSIR